MHSKAKTVDLAALTAAILAGAPPAAGSVIAVTGSVIRVDLPDARIGAWLEIGLGRPPLIAEVVGFDRNEAVALPLSRGESIGCGTSVKVVSGASALRASDALFGRVLGPLGDPIDEGGAIEEGRPWELRRNAPNPLRRRPVSRALPLGVRAIDALCTVGAGQRIGLHSGPGAGKTTLLAQIARQCAADAIIVGLIGERGREVGDFLSQLPAEARGRAVVVVARADDPPLAWLRGVELCTALAEYFRSEGRDVLLLCDSLTRVARAIRTVGVAAGEPASRRGYPPSLATTLPALVERAANDELGTLTAVYTVLVEGDPGDDPVAEEAQALLDGHIVLDQALAGAGRFPALAVGRSISRCMDAVVEERHARAARRLRRWIAAIEGHRDLVVVGAYREGGDLDADRALAQRDSIEAFLRQPADLVAPFDETVAEMYRITGV